MVVVAAHQVRACAPRCRALPYPPAETPKQNESIEKSGLSKAWDSRRDDRERNKTLARERTELLLHARGRAGPTISIGLNSTFNTVGVTSRRTDYIDLCGEPEFMQRMTLKYHEEAQAKGVLVMHACAFGKRELVKFPPRLHEGGVVAVIATSVWPRALSSLRFLACRGETAQSWWSRICGAAASD